MRTGSTTHRVFAFGEFRLDATRGALLKRDTEIRLRPKSFDVLRYLVERHGELVSKEQLFAAIWGRSVVSSDSLTQCLIDARKAIHDRSRQAIRTVPRRGYIFTLAVQEYRVPDPGQTADESDRAGETRSKWLTGAASALAIVLVVLGAGAYMTRDWINPDTEDLGVESPAIAVLPFVDMSPEGNNHYFSEGVSEEILNLLGPIPDLRVVARSSSFSFKDRNADIATIAEKLSVSYVLEGSVRRSDDRVRVTAQLIDASSGMHVWSHTYDRQLGDVLDVQIEIADAVANALQVKLTGGADSHDALINIQSYEHFQQAQFLFNRRLPGDLYRARDQYRKTLDRDPHYAPAWAGIAGTYLVQTVSGELVPEIGWSRMRDAVAEALSLNPRLAEAHVRADQYHTHTGDHDSALEHRRKALQYGPNSPLVLSRVAGSSALRGRFNEAIDFQRRAVALDPLAVVGHLNFALFLRAAGRFDEAREQFLSALTLNPDMEPELVIELGFLLILQGRFDEALPEILEWPEGPERDQAMALVYYAIDEKAEADAALANLMQRPGNVAHRVAEIYAYRGEIDEAFRWLTGSHDHLMAMEQSSYDRRIEDICLSPFLRSLHDDPRWDRMMDSSAPNSVLIRTVRKRPDLSRGNASVIRAAGWQLPPIGIAAPAIVAGLVSRH